MRSSLVPNIVDARSAREPADSIPHPLTVVTELALAAAIAVHLRPSLDMFVARSTMDHAGI